MPGPGRGLGAIVLLAVLFAILILGGDEEGGDPAGAGGADRGPLRGEVTRVVDGDTVEVELGGTVDDVRLIGVDTPESVQPGEPVECFGAEASAFTRELLEGEAVRLELDRERRDAYDRLLAYVYLRDLFVNAELVRQGYARTLEIAPNTAHAEQLAKLEREAGSTGAGLWSVC